VNDDPGILIQVLTPSDYQWVPRKTPIEVTGWAIARDRLVDIYVTCGNARLSATRGLYRADLAQAFPNRDDIAKAGFAVSIVPPHDCPAGTSLIVTALCANGAQKQIEIPLYLDQTARLEKQEPLALYGSEAVALTFDDAFVDALGFLVLEGRFSSQTLLEKIEIFIDGRFAGQALQKENRFSFVADLADHSGPLQVSARASASGGFTSETATQVEAVGRSFPRKPHGEMQRLEFQRAVLSPNGEVLLSGYAVAVPKITGISVFHADERLGDAVYGGVQPAIGNLLPSLPHAHFSGFFFSAKLPARPRDSLFELEVLLENGRTFRSQVIAVGEQSAAKEANHDIIFMLDEPKLVDGSVEEPLLGGLSIGGWALSRSGVARIAVELDGKEVGTAYHGMRRQDVFSIYPDWPKSLFSGFAFSLPHRAFSVGEHVVTLKVMDENGAEHIQSFGLTVGTGDVQDRPWILRRKIPAAEHLLIRTLLEEQKAAPRLLLCMTAAGAALDQIKRTLQSLEVQIYANWRLIIGAPAKSKNAITVLLESFPTLRTRAVFLDKAKAKPGDWLLRIDPGHECTPDMLAEFALSIEANKGCDLIYADERCIDAATGEVDAFFKPDWSPHLLTSMNYIGRPFAVPIDNAADLAALAKISDYDLLLEHTEKAKTIVHVAKLLYERHDRPESKDEKATLERMVKRRKLKASVEPGRTAETYQLKSKSKPEGLVSIIIPTCAARGLIERCLDSIRTRSTYKNIEIIIVDNILDPESRWKPWLIDHADVVVEILEPFNWSRFNNVAAEEAGGDYLLFLNDDIEIIQSDWLEALLADAADPSVGVVGPQLLYPDGKVQHAGIYLSELGTGRHAFRFNNDDDPGYFGLALTRRNVIALTGACLLMRRDVFDAVGGFDESHTIINNDLDFCLKVHERGWWNVYSPFAQLIHHELASRSELKDEHDKTSFNERWASLFYRGDPFFSRYLSRSHDGYQYDAEPEKLVVCGHPYYLRESIRRILVIKVDHIGDFITGLPALRRLKQHFPEAHLTVLAAPASLQLAECEPAIDEVIPFAFFHTRSSLGLRELDETELSNLRAVLAEKRFDLAIDLRKHPETRTLLKHTGAPILAGFEHAESMPWLDIARPSEKDVRYTLKHTNIGDDLLGLIEDIALAGEPARQGILMDEAFKKKARAMRARFGKMGMVAGRPVVAFHLAAGNPIKQWPPAYFAMLIRWLIERNGVTAVLIGTEDDDAIVAETLAHIVEHDHIVSLAGKLKLSELPYFLANCALFVGNDSGPKHIAAALGVPAIGIHPGVVDPQEWGPLGERAVAIKKEMSCSPCYLSKAEDCHRGLACLTQLTPGAVFPICQRLLGLSAS